jgi:hypothetical protein
MPFGLCNAEQSFQRLMDEVINGLDFAFCQLDNILIGSISTEEHLCIKQRLFLALHFIHIYFSALFPLYYIL